MSTEYPPEQEPVDEARYILRFRVERPIDFVPTRVISLVPSLTETLFDLNLGGRLIGVTNFCVRPEESVARLPKVGGTKNPDLQKIIALRPDLVLMNTEENRKADAEALKAAGITVWATGPRSVFEAIELLWLIMDVFEDASMVHRVRLIHTTYETTRKYMTEGGPMVRVFAPIWRDPWMTFNADTYVHDLLYSCGAENIFAERDRQPPEESDGRDRRYPRILLEEVVALQPQLVLLPSEPYAFSEVDQVEVERALADTPAGKNHHIHRVDGSLLTWHGTRIAYALRDLPPIIADAAETPAEEDDCL